MNIQSAVVKCFYLSKNFHNRKNNSFIDNSRLAIDVESTS